MAKPNEVAQLLTQVQAGVKSVATTALQSVTEITRQVNSFTRQFVEAFRPDVVMRFDRAARDLLATIGQGMVPVMEAGERVVRLLADTMDGLYKTVRPLIDGGFALLRPALEQVAIAVRELGGGVIGEMLPMVRQLAEVFKVYAAELLPVMLSAFKQLAPAVISVYALVISGLIPAIKAISPLLATVGKLSGSLLPILLMPFKLLAAVAGPFIQMALLPLTTGLRLLNVVLSPVVTVLTAVLDAFNSIYDAVSELVGEILSSLLNSVQELMSAVGDLLKPVADLGRLLLNGLVTAIRTATAAIIGIINSLREFLGIKKADVNLKGNSVGKATSQATFTSAEDSWRRVVEATASMGRGTEQKKPEERSASALEKIWGWIDTNKEGLSAVINRRKDNVANHAAHSAAPIPMLMLDMMRNSVIRGR